MYSAETDYISKREDDVKSGGEKKRGYTCGHGDLFPHKHLPLQDNDACGYILLP